MTGTTCSVCGAPCLLDAEGDRLCAHCRPWQDTSHDAGRLCVYCDEPIPKGRTDGFCCDDCAGWARVEDTMP